MTKKEKEKEVSRHYRLVHQIVSLTGINFQTKSIIGSVARCPLAVSKPLPQVCGAHPDPLPGQPPSHPAQCQAAQDLQVEWRDAYFTVPVTCYLMVLFSEIL